MEIEADRVQKVLYNRLIGGEKIFDLKVLHKFITKSNRESIVTNLGT